MYRYSELVLTVEENSDSRLVVAATPIPDNIKIRNTACNIRLVPKTLHTHIFC